MQEPGPEGGPQPARAVRDPRSPPEDVAATRIDWTRRLGAELIGTFALVFVAAGADTTAVVSGGAVSVAARAVAPALMVAALIYAISDASGAHFNPVVSLAFTIERVFSPRWLVPYWLAQLGGAVGAALLLSWLFGSASRAGVSTPHVTPATALAIEAILTAVLLVVILGTADRARIVGPESAIAVGATIALCGLVALPIEGASMNPARSAGPAIVAGDLGNLWIYLVGPVVGAGIAVLATRLIHGPATPDGGTAEAAQGDARSIAGTGDDLRDRPPRRAHE
jgi:aquaporin Z